MRGLGVMIVGRGLFKTLIPVSEAISIVRDKIGWSLAARLLDSIEKVPIEDLVGRLVARDIRAPVSLPRYPRSIVDGCALRSVDVAGAFEDRPVVLRLAGRVKIGEKPSLRIGEGECALVDTGSWVPLGADAVVPIEYVSIKGKEARVERARPPGANIALPASDVAEGDIVAWRGAPGTPELAAALAAVGVREIEASRRPRVAVLSTGEELVEPGSPPSEAGVYDSNRFYLLNAFRYMGYDVVDLGIAGDREDEVVDRIMDAIKRGADVIVTSGGTSAGVDDVVPRAVARIGEVIFHGLRIKPGKPTLAGIVDGTLIVGLPGNPRSTANVIERFVAPLLSAIGLPLGPIRPEVIVRARLASDVAGERGRTTYVPAAIVSSYAIPVARESYMIASYPLADGVIIVPPGSTGPLERGSMVDVRSWRQAPKTLLMLTDTRLPEAHAMTGMPSSTRVLYSPMVWETAKSMARDVEIPAIAAAPEHVDPGSGWSELGLRGIVLLKRSGSCSEVAAYAPYASQYREAIPAGSRVIASRRAMGAVILFRDGYADCALVPSDYVEPAAEGDKADLKIEEEEIGRERILLYRPRDA